MDAIQQISIQDQIAEVTECSICTEIFTEPKVLPCVHTFCLHCLEKYGKDKKAGDQMVCPLCRKEFFIPDGGFSHLPSNFFIGKLVHIGRTASTSTNKVLCALCSEDEEVLAQLFCLDCEQNLCTRCGNGHKKSRVSQHHQVFEVGSQPKALELKVRNSYCEHHPGEMIKMFCYEDNVAICLVCCAESHQSHRCVNVNKVAAEKTEQLKKKTEKVASRLSECIEFSETLDKFKQEFEDEVFETEECIRDAENKMIELIKNHAQLLLQNLKSIRERNLKAFEVTKQDIDRFRVMIDSFSRYSEELLTRGSPVDICRTTNQMLTRAQELETLPVNCSGGSFCCNTIAFNPSHFENLMKPNTVDNAVGELDVILSLNWRLQFGSETSVADRFLAQKFYVNTIQKEHPSISDRIIKVSNIPSSITEEALEMVFENKRNKGGDTDDIVYNQGKGTAVITFKDPEVAKTLIQQEVLMYKTNRLAITKYVEESIEDSKQNKTSPVSGRMVDVSNIPSDMTRDVLTLLLENSSGGDIECIDHDQNRNTAVATFKDSVAADILISEESVVHKEKRLSIRKHVEKVDERKQFPKEEKEKTASSNRSIFVSKIPPKLSEDYLVMFFENKRSGGGKTENVAYDPAQGTAVITFEDSKVAASFVEKESVDFKGQRMFVRKHDDQTVDAVQGKDSGDEGNAKELPSPKYVASGSFNTVKISGIPKGVSTDMISMYFENKKRSGGGILRAVEHQKEKGKAVLQFHYPEDGLEVCKRTHALSGATVDISPLEMPLDDVKSCAIEVKGLNERASVNILELYFENTVRSGGGPVEKVFLNKETNTAIVVFEEATAVMEVMKKQPHKFYITNLEVNVLKAAPPPPLLLTDVDAKRLLAKRLPPSTTKDSLREYLCPAANAKMIGWTEAVKHSTALLEFSSEPDYLSIRRLVCSKPYLGKMISIRRVPLTSSVLVTGLPPSVTSDHIAMYFENPRNGGNGEECRVELLPDNCSAVVKFDRPDIIPAITSRSHQFEGKPVKVEPYFPWLGRTSA